MSSLDDLFNVEGKTYEKKETPLLRLDWKKGQSARIRTKTPPNKWKLVIRHWVDGVGYVHCGQPQGVVTKRDEKGNERKVPVLWTKDRNKKVTCEFCQERSELRNKYKADAVKRGDKDMSKEESNECSKLHKRQINLYAEAEVTVTEDGIPVDGLENVQRAVAFNVIDLFFEQQDKAYKQLESIQKLLKTKKREFMDYWFVIDSKGQIQRDDEVTKEEKKTEISVDLSFLDEQTKDYNTGLAEYKQRKESGDLAVPDEEEMVMPAEEEAKDDDLAF